MESPLPSNRTWPYTHYHHHTPLSIQHLWSISLSCPISLCIRDEIGEREFTGNLLIKGEGVFSRFVRCGVHDHKDLVIVPYEFQDETICTHFSSTMDLSTGPRKWGIRWRRIWGRNRLMLVPFHGLRRNKIRPNFYFDWSFQETISSSWVSTDPVRQERHWVILTVWTGTGDWEWVSPTAEVSCSWVVRFYYFIYPFCCWGGEVSSKGICVTPSSGPQILFVFLGEFLCSLPFAFGPRFRRPSVEKITCLLIRCLTSTPVPVAPGTSLSRSDTPGVLGCRTRWGHRQDRFTW